MYLNVVPMHMVCHFRYISKRWFALLLFAVLVECERTTHDKSECIKSRGSFQCLARSMGEIVFEVRFFYLNSFQRPSKDERGWDLGILFRKSPKETRNPFSKCVKQVFPVSDSVVRAMFCHTRFLSIYLARIGELVMSTCMNSSDSYILMEENLSVSRSRMDSNGNALNIHRPVWPIWKWLYRFLYESTPNCNYLHFISNF